jgi:tetratricopeptide (TPR) repeat protein
MLEGRQEQALDYLQMAEPLYLKTKDYPELAGVLQNLLALYQKMALWQEAIDAGRKAVTVLERLDDRMRAAFAYNDTARVYLQELNQPKEAAYGYRIALTYARMERLKLEDEIQAGLEMCLGGPRSMTERVETATKQDQIVAAVLASVPNWEKFTSTEKLRDELRNRAEMSKKSDPDAAIALWRTVAALSWEQDDQNWLAGALNEAGMICAQTNEAEMAKWYYEEASRISREVHDWNQLAMCQYNLGTLLAQQGELVAAREAMKEAEENARRMGDTMSLQKVLDASAKLEIASD